MILDILNKLINSKQDEIHQWFLKEYQTTPPFFYSSVDIRYSSNKLVPVDTNLFPAGFNLLSNMGQKNAINRIKDYFDFLKSKTAKQIKNVILIPENHTRNTYYLDNVASIKSLIERAGCKLIICLPNIDEPIEVQSASRGKLVMHPLNKCDENNVIFTEILGQKFIPELVIVNNDLTSGAPDILQNVKQCVIPPVGMGWYRRRKIEHFESYHEIATQFANKFEFDPWLISSVIKSCGVLNFHEKKGLECIARNAEKAFYQIRKKYEEYGIKQKPYLFVKADSGTYGMGVMILEKPEDIFDINKKDRKKMNAIKEGVTNSRVILQEGIPSSLSYADDGKKHSAESLAYLIGGCGVDLIMRGNSEAGEYKNLNARGMFFKNADDILTNTGVNNKDIRENFLHNTAPYFLISELASLAATRECYEPDWSI